VITVFKRIGLIFTILGMCLLASSIAALKISYGTYYISLDPSSNNVKILIRSITAATHRIIINQILEEENVGQTQLRFLILETKQIESWARGESVSPIVNETLNFDQEEIEKSFIYTFHRSGVYVFIIENIGDNYFSGTLKIIVERLEINKLWGQFALLSVGLIILAVDITYKRHQK